MCVCSLHDSMFNYSMFIVKIPESPAISYLKHHDKRLGPLNGRRVKIIAVAQTSHEPRLRRATSRSPMRGAFVPLALASFIDSEVLITLFRLRNPGIPPAAPQSNPPPFTAHASRRCLQPLQARRRLQLSQAHQLRPQSS